MKKLKGGRILLLNKLLSNFNYKVLQGDINIEISHISTDSRKIKKGTLFLCLVGSRYDSHDFIQDSIDNGAVAIIIEKDIDINHIPKSVTVVKVDNTRKVVPIISNIFYDYPSKSFTLIGVTGTNGKSSFCHILAKALEDNNNKIGLIGTNEIRIGKKILVKGKRTPTVPVNEELQQIFKQMKDDNVAYVLIEVSSIALETGRVDGCDFDIGVFTNLSKDHLNRHENMENYLKSKKKLFDFCKIGLFNNDDIYTGKMKENVKCRIYSYGITNDANYTIDNVKLEEEITRFNINSKNYNIEAKTNLLGQFNLYNILSAFAVCDLLGIDKVNITKSIESILSIPGRLEEVRGKNKFRIFIDYAHSPQALKSLYRAIMPIKKGRIISVFSHGFNRDVSIRKSMGDILSYYSDVLIVTSNNYFEEKYVSEISNDLLINNHTLDLRVINSRREAIKLAIQEATNDDVILVIGNGSNTYSINNNNILTTDKEVILTILDEDKLREDE